MHISCTHCRAEVDWKHDAPKFLNEKQNKKMLTVINSIHMKYYLVITHAVLHSSLVVTLGKYRLIYIYIYIIIISEIVVQVSA